MPKYGDYFQKRYRPGPDVRSLDELKVNPNQVQPAVVTDRAEVKGAWDLAWERAEEAYGLLAPAVKQLQRRMAWDVGTEYQFLQEPAAPIPDRRDAYLVIRELDEPDPERPTRRRYSTSTPGYRWRVSRMFDERGTRLIAETMVITLTVNAEGVAQLRCGDKVVAATAEEWTLLTEGVLEARSTRMKNLVLSLAFLPFNFGFWLLLLPIAVVVALVVFFTSR